MFSLTKKFEFDYGHRVFTQDVDPVYAGNAECPCRRLHGHRGVVTVCFEAETLDHRGFVIDFKELSFIKQFLDTNIDHRFIISLEDPGFERLVGISSEEIDSCLSSKYLLSSKFSEYIGVGFMGERIDCVPEDPHLDSFFIVDFNPTSENLSKWIYEGLIEVLNDSDFECNVKYVNWSETPKTGATYSCVDLDKNK